MSKRLFFSFSLELLEPEHGPPSIRIVAFGPPSEFPPHEGRLYSSLRCLNIRELAAEFIRQHQELDLLERLAARCFSYRKKYGSFPHRKKRKER